MAAMTYTCHTCKVAHSEDNMVAHCAVCYDKMRGKQCKHLTTNKPDPDATLLKEMLAESQAALSSCAEALKAGLSVIQAWRETHKDNGWSENAEAMVLLAMSQPAIARVSARWNWLEQVAKAARTGSWHCNVYRRANTTGPCGGCLDCLLAAEPAAGEGKP